MRTEGGGRYPASLLPRTLPDIRNLAIAWKFRPPRDRGDMFNVFRLDEDSLACT
jgi:hypothetical protein